MKVCLYQNGNFQLFSHVLQSANIVPRDVRYGGKTLTFTRWLNTANCCVEIVLCDLN